MEFLTSGLAHAGAWGIVLYTLATTHLTIIGVTVYLHRSQAHRSVTLHPAVAHVLRFWLWLSTGMVTREWVAVHRAHHAHCERPEDPHSPVVLGIRKVLLEGAELYRTAAADGELVRRYGAGTPDDWIERHLYSRFTWQGVGVLLVLDLLLFGVIGATVWAVQMLWIPVLAAGVINGAGHYWGYRNFDCPEAATNLLPLGLLIGGEELHNNHHAFASSAKMSVRWYEFDAGWMVITLLRWLGLAQVRPLPVRPRALPGKREVDMDTLSVVLANRARVMAELSGALGRVWREETAALRRFDPALWRHARALLPRDPGYLDGEQLHRLQAVLAHSDVLRHVHELRSELAALWRRSHASPEQLLASLTAWCAKAEASACEPLRRYAGRLRSYA
ncbi:fatty acid desaturase [[Empedobacter] haloabium]|uniref:Fatty acid desaturase n=1 Tax=[Empedobacter] haloabium TaxID=592317 RepID=A0ABZ1UJJ3_9BURK